MTNHTTQNGSLDPNPPHIVLIPLMAQGHMIPMLDMARLLATVGSTVTFITTPVNAARIRPTIDRITTSHLTIHFVELQFPSAAANLPPNCENLDLLPSPTLFKPFLSALTLFGEKVELFLAENVLRADCIVFDVMNSWAPAVAESLGIPHVVFYGPSCYFMLCRLLLEKHDVLKRVDDDVTMFRVPGLPGKVEVTKPQVESWMDKPGWEEIRERFVEAGKSAHGVVMNTFEELEMSGLRKFREETGKKVHSQFT